MLFLFERFSPFTHGISGFLPTESSARGKCAGPRRTPGGSVWKPLSVKPYHSGNPEFCQISSSNLKYFVRIPGCSLLPPTGPGDPPSIRSKPKRLKPLRPNQAEPPTTRYSKISKAPSLSQPLPHEEEPLQSKSALLKLTPLLSPQHQLPGNIPGWVAARAISLCDTLGCQEDYKELSRLPDLPTFHRKFSMS